MADPVPPFNFQGIQCGLLASFLGSLCENLGKQADLFRQLDDCTANGFQCIHERFAPVPLGLHQSQQAPEYLERPRIGLRRMRSGSNQRPRVMLQFFVAMRTSIRIKKIAKLGSTVRTFGFGHFDFRVGIRQLSCRR